MKFRFEGWWGLWFSLVRILGRVYMLCFAIQRIILVRLQSSQIRSVISSVYGI